VVVRGGGEVMRAHSRHARLSAQRLCLARMTARPHQSRPMSRADRARTRQWASALPAGAAPAGRPCPGAAHDGVSRPDPGLLAHRPPELLGVSSHEQRWLAAAVSGTQQVHEIAHSPDIMAPNSWHPARRDRRRMGREIGAPDGRANQFTSVHAGRAGMLLHTSPKVTGTVHTDAPAGTHGRVAARAQRTTQAP
jgi:hypothetical protein